MVEALGVDDDEITSEATLLGDLGAESIDLLDILFRLERKLGIKIQTSDIISYIQGVATRGEILFGRLKFLGAKFPGCGIPNASTEDHFLPAPR